MAKESVFLDINIIMDALYQRTPWCEDASKIISMAEEGRIDAYMAAISVDTLSFLLRKNHSPKQITGIIINLRKILNIATVDNHVIDHALSLNWNDLEDAIQYASAIHAQCAVLITRNLSDYRGHNENIRVVGPADFLRDYTVNS
ncbi:MAG: PIN domain-containing protein [Bacteroidetes bacterium]|nr:PIN domain-containing protein [Bacteroidota bacterium]MCH8524985.1 PIN domain-containing protein [Balneolales bacterium]